MPDRRLLVIGLDAFDSGVAAELMRQGELPALAALEKSAARFELDHGIEKYTGLAWEQFSTGQSPQAVERWSACTFDSRSYSFDQPTTRLPPFAAGLDVSTVIFDTPYFDLARAPAIRGMVSWGSHDPGVPVHCNPSTLADEIEGRFGPYPATPYIYGHVWADAARTEDMARAMVAAVDRRSDITHWLLSQRLPDWDLAITVLSEFHSATEALWHGWDDGHPLHRLPSAVPARAGLIGVYRAADRMLGRLIDAFPDASVLAFAPHGMGRNIADTAAMILVPELLYRHFIGRQGLYPLPDWECDGSAGTAFAASHDWAQAIHARLDLRPHRRGMAGAWDAWRAWRRPLPPATGRHAVDWMPTTQYRIAWPAMKAFAVPAYYDARIRVNLIGREARGLVRPADYETVLDEVEGLIAACRDPQTSEPLGVVFERRPGDPIRRHPSDVDLVVRVKRDHYAFDHPCLGRIGPVPCRRTGGHSGGLGVGYLTGVPASGAIGRFPTLDVSALVQAMMGDPRATGRLVDALVRPVGRPQQTAASGAA